MKSEGFIAITSAIIISVLLLAIVFTLSFSGFFVRFNILDSEYKSRSEALAEACIDKAILNLAQSVNYTGDVTVDSSTSPQTVCKIIDVNLDAGLYTLHTSAEFPQSGSNKTVTNLEAKVDHSDFSLVSVQELSSY